MMRQDDDSARAGGHAACRAGRRLAAATATRRRPPTALPRRSRAIGPWRARCRPPSATPTCAPTSPPAPRGSHARLDVSPPPSAARLRGKSPDELRARIRGLEPCATRPTASPTLQAIAACESGGNPATDTGNGFYGKYQFDLQTWQAVGGTGNPAQASEAEQDRRAAVLYAQAGPSPWPVCGR